MSVLVYRWIFLALIASGANCWWMHFVRSRRVREFEETFRLKFWFSRDGRHAGFFETLIPSLFAFTPSSFLEEKVGPVFSSSMYCFFFAESEYVSSKAIIWRLTDYLMYLRYSALRLSLEPPSLLDFQVWLLFHRMKYLLRFMNNLMLDSSAELYCTAKDKSRVRSEDEK